MPDQSPPLDDPGLVQHAARAGKPDFWVHPLAAATRGLQGREMAEIGLMKAAGAKAVATGRHWIADSGIMLRVLQYASALGRSEEHTSELQSLMRISYAVFCLKKKTQPQQKM